MTKSAWRIKSSHLVGVVCLIAAGWSAYGAYSTFLGRGELPSDCVGRHGESAALCQVGNFIYDLGGRPAIGILWLVSAMVFAPNAVRLLLYTQPLRRFVPQRWRGIFPAERD